MAYNKLDGKQLPLSDATPQAASGAGTSGTSTDVSRADHVHPAASVSTPSVSTVAVFDDFIGVGTITNSSTGLTQMSNGSSVGLATTYQSNSHPGVIQLAESTVSNYSGMQTGATFRLGGGAIILRTAIYIPTLNNGSDDFQFFFGLGGPTVNSTSDPTYAIYLTYNNGYGANWRACTANNGPSTTNDTGTAAAAGAWTKLRIEINAAGTSVAYYINDVLEDTITTNIPSSSQDLRFYCKFQKAVGSNQRTLHVDYMGLDWTLSNAR